MIKDVKEMLDYLKLMAKTYEVEDVCNFLLDDKRLPLWSGSGKSFQHHYGQGGLITHLTETVQLCFINKAFFPNTEIDDTELFMSALFHDAGKLYDYKPVDYYDNWEGTDHKRYIHHISRSAIMWSEACKRNDSTYEKYHDKVLHAILSHHGTREHGSPVAPKSRVAWLVHLCDGISARMYDADSWDMIRS